MALIGTILNRPPQLPDLMYNYLALLVAIVADLNSTEALYRMGFDVGGYIRNKTALEKLRALNKGELEAELNKYGSAVSMGKAWKLNCEAIRTQAKAVGVELKAGRRWN